MKFTLLAAFLILEGISIPKTACSETVVFDKQNPKRYLEALTKAFKIKKGSKHYQRLFESAVSGGDDSGELGEKRKVNIIRHVKGKDGIPFPLLKGSAPKAFDFKAEDLKALAAKGVQMMQYSIRKVTHPDKIPSCSQSRSIRTPISPYGKKYGSEVLRDVLFIDKDEIPRDPQAFYGKRVIVRGYSTDPKNPVYYEAAGLGIDCLPTRIRITGMYSIRDTGDAALRNYENNPNGKGFICKPDKSTKGKYESGKI